MKGTGFHALRELPMADGLPEVDDGGEFEPPRVVPLGPELGAVREPRSSVEMRMLPEQIPTAGCPACEQRGVRHGYHHTAACKRARAQLVVPVPMGPASMRPEDFATPADRHPQVQEPVEPELLGARDEPPDDEPQEM